jgi:hypothetical protein
MLTISAAALCLAACGSEPEEETGFPTRDWSGPYALEVVEATTDCEGAEAPPPLGEAVLEVRQAVDNSVTTRIGPLVSMDGGFDGDELEAAGAITQPIPLPDSLASRADEADSLETITYGLQATFRQDGTLEGTYRIGAPDLVALARGTGAHRCEYVYEVRGAPRLSSRPAQPTDPAPAERR